MSQGSRKSKLFRLALAIVPALAIAGFFALATSNPHSWTDGLVGYWSFDGQYTTSTNGTRDVSNNGNWGTFNGGVKPIAGIVGQALSFDGVDDYVDAGNNTSLNITGPITIEAWFKTSINQVNKALVGKWDTDEAYVLQYGGAANVNDIRFHIRISDVSKTGISLGSGYNDGLWHHVVGIYNGASVIVYIDGVSGTPVSASGSIDTTVDALNIGNYARTVGGGGINYFNGLIDEVRIYNRALSADEVKQHYDQTRRNLIINQPSGTPPVGWWKMDEGTGQTVRDYSVNANNGTVSNGGYGATSTDGKIGKALNFDGTNDYIDAGSGASLDITDAITIETWVKPTQDTTGIYRGIITKQDATIYAGYLLAMSDNTFWFRIYDTAGGQPLSGADSTYTIGTWYHLVAVKGGNQVLFYVNGIEQSWKSSSLYAIKSNTQTLKIGRYWTDIADFYFNGLIDEVRIYNYARTAEQIQHDYLAGATRLRIAASNPHDWSNGLVGYWNFDGQNTTSTNGTRDISGNNNWGTFNGGPTPKAGISGQALSFDGVNDYVDMGDNTTASPMNFTTSDFSIEMWVKFNDLDAIQVLFSRGLHQIDGYYFDMRSSGGIYFSTDGGVPDNTANTYNIGLTAGVWQHIVAVKSGSTVTIYKNTTAYTSGVSFQNPASTTRTTKIGVYGNGTSNPFDGLIDEVRIYNRALSADEIQQHYLQTRRNLRI